MHHLSVSQTITICCLPVATIFCFLSFHLHTSLPGPVSSLQPLHSHTDTHPLSSFSLLIFFFSWSSFTSISALSWTRVTVSIFSSCRFLWQHTSTRAHTHANTDTHSICNQSTTIYHTNDLLRQIGQPAFHQYVQFICCTSTSLLPRLINTLIN